MPLTWSPDQIARRERVERGFAVVANRKRDKALIAWAEDEGRAVYIGRTMPRLGLVSTGWENPFKIPDDGTREEVIALFRARILPELLPRIGELRGGKVLLCWCYPERCHGDLLCEAV